MKLKAISKEFPPVSKLILALGILLISMFVFSMLNFGIAFVFYGVSPFELTPLLNDLSSDRALEIAKVLQTVSSIGFFIAPAILLAWLFSDHISEFLKTDKKINISAALLVTVTLVIAIPLINYLGELNSRMLLPSALGGVQDWMKGYENRADTLSESFLKMETPGDMVLSIFLIGILPAVGEELFFRGILQRILTDWTKNKHWGIWITALVFSTIHLQFFGFVPRLLLGVILGYLFTWSGSLWLPMIGHFVYNTAAVVLTYIYSSGLISFNPINMGLEDGSILPVLVSALLVGFLLLLINLREKQNKWMHDTVEYSTEKIIDYEKVLVDYFDKPTVKPAMVVAKEEPIIPIVIPEVIHVAPVIAPIPAAVKVVEAAPTSRTRRKAELTTDASPMSGELENFELTDFSDQAQQEMITRMDLPFKLGSASYISFLNQYGFIKLDADGTDPRPTGLGLLMLGKSPQLHFPQARIKFTIHREKEEPVIKDFEGPLVLMPAKIEDFLDVIISSSINRDQFHRVVLSEIPKKVLREVIINAIVHRDYSIEGARIMVDAYKDRVEVSSPGIPKYPIKKFYDCSVPSVSRNQKISYIFNQMHLVEERGLGMKELKTLKEDGNPPDFKLDSDIFTTIIYRSKKAVSKEPEETPNLTEEAVKIYIKQKVRISAGDYSKKFNVTTKTAQRHLNKLIEDGLVEKDGDKKGTKYFLKEDSRVVQE